MSVIYINSYQFAAAAPPSGYDPDAAAYIARVEGVSGDNAPLETAVKDAINAFVVGCKADGIWDAIKASCILAGARTLNGALVPLVGAAPTNFNFVSGDYGRKSGLAGDGSTKYLNSNRNNNADPQDNNHNAVYLTTAGTATSAYMGADLSTTSTGTNNFGRSTSIFFRSRSSTVLQVSIVTATGLIGTSRQSSTGYTARALGSNSNATTTSQTPFDGSISIFASGRGAFPTNARIAFYSIGESLDLAKLDARVTTLINAFASAIP